MRVQTSRFGEIEVDEANVVTFSAGIIGFPSMTRYVLRDHDRDMPFQWLQSLDNGDLAFIVMNPTLVTMDYRVALGPQEIADLGSSNADDLTLWVILTVPSPDPNRITANLQGPIIINTKTHYGKQLVLREEHPTRYPLFQNIDAAVPTEKDDAAPLAGMYP